MATDKAPAAYPPLREPSKPETRIGWWFMRRFRAKEVAVRTARNRVMQTATIAAERFDLPELRAALDGYCDACEARDA